ncbi:YqaJ viral recombinase family protein [Gemmatimonas sp.]|uniref:YqaJ viral recombinase family nuclease n=1 Tax=Gemmatimonas sp. TaxID=1962908 RepID=UPI00333E4D06
MTAPTLEYGSAEWQADRANYIGASDTPLMLNVSEYGGKLDLYHLKRGEKVIEPTPAMLRGHIYEPAICADFLLNFPDFRAESVGTVSHPAGDFLRATVDRVLITPNGRGILEAKNVTPRFMAQYGESGSDEAPLDKIAQVQTQMEVMDLPWAYIAVNFGFELRWYFIERDREIGEAIVEQAFVFMRDHVIPGIPPEPTPGVDTYESITRRFLGSNKETLKADEATAEMIAEFAAVKAAKKAAEEREEQLKSLLATKIGTAYGVDAGAAGYVLWPESEGKISKDFDGLVRELNVPPDVVQKYLRVGSPYRTMRHYPPKKRK